VLCMGRPHGKDTTWRSWRPRKEPGLNVPTRLEIASHCLPLEEAFRLPVMHAVLRVIFAVAVLTSVF
jgi:hypothetical protein